MHTVSSNVGAVTGRYRGGPVRLVASFDDEGLRDALDAHLGQYDALWSGAVEDIEISVESVPEPASQRLTPGAYMRTGHLQVDRRGSEIESVGYQGTELLLDESTWRARLRVPYWRHRPTLVEEAEQQLILLCARAWAARGWTPVHAATVIRPGTDRCALICAPSGSGKTTLVFALLRRGWRTLGDDKALVRVGSGGVEGRALAGRLHLDPAGSRWLQEAGDVSRWPRYSMWTDKRRVPLEAVWPGALVERGRPGCVVRLERGQESAAVIACETMDGAETMQTLLRQVALPGDAAHARPLMKTCAALAGLPGLCVRVGPGAFDDGAALDGLAEAIGRAVG